MSKYRFVWEARGVGPKGVDLALEARDEGVRHGADDAECHISGLP